MDDIARIALRPVTECGWKRRAELDTDTYDYWEMPDGTPRLTGKGNTPVVCVPMDEKD